MKDNYREFDFKNEARDDFSNPDVRGKMNEALAWFESKCSIETSYSVIIGGEQIRESAMFLLEFDPAFKKRILGSVYTANFDLIDRACRVAKEDYYRMQNEPVCERILVVREALRLMREEKYKFAAIMVYESSKSQEGALAEVEEAIDFAEVYSEHIEEITKPVLFQPNLSTESNILFRVGRGPTVVISPWNFPLSLLFGRFIDSYLAGCPVLVKPAEQSSIVAWHIIDLLSRAGINKNAIAFLPGRRDIGEALVKNPLVANICFTGSKPVGFSVNLNAAETLGEFGQKRVDLELGGINSMIITPSADPDESIKGVITSKFGQQGQKCSALQRLILTGKKEHWDSWLKRLCEAVSSLEWGHPADRIKRYKYNALIDVNAQSRIKEKVRRAKRLASPILEIDLASDKYLSGYFAGPVIFTNLPHNHPVVKEEIFGPVLFIFFAESLVKAVEMAGEYPHITSGIYSLFESEIDYFVSEMKKKGSGNIYINRPITGSMVGRNPFGGRRQSGSGLKTGIPERLNFFLDEVTVTRNYLSQGTLMRIKK